MWVENNRHALMCMGVFNSFLMIVNNAFNELKLKFDEKSDYKSRYAKVISADVINRNVNIDFMNEYGNAISNMAFPIIVDRLYPLEHVSHAIEYVNSHNNKLLGENIGILIAKEENFEPENESNVWYPVQLDDIDNYSIDTYLS